MVFGPEGRLENQGTPMDPIFFLSHLPLGHTLLPSSGKRLKDTILAATKNKTHNLCKLRAQGLRTGAYGWLGLFRPALNLAMEYL
jgi:hypothetical protein